MSNFTFLCIELQTDRQHVEVGSAQGIRT